MREFGDVVVCPEPAPGFDTVTRPTGDRVDWHAIPAVNKDCDVAVRRGIPIKGVLGEAAYHLPRYGGHTPWRYGSAIGPVWACDLGVTPAQWARILSELRTGKWDLVVRFVNYGGRQYWNDDTFASSTPNPDEHLHLEYRDAARTYDGPSLLQAALDGEDEATMAEIRAELLELLKTDDAVKGAIRDVPMYAPGLDPVRLADAVAGARIHLTRDRDLDPENERDVIPPAAPAPIDYRLLASALLVELAARPPAA